MPYPLLSDELRLAGVFPRSAARLRHVAGTRWGIRKYLDMNRLYELERQREQEKSEKELSVAV